ncbi:positive regulator of sigma(E), RseC/MucC [Aedoeadaptatus coxii]|uniref:SoxR reducing system RseC family protein n=1 Tax=Aedoeadaptatus coxii TaxID=755172 RepID=UPI001764B78C|nr:SoxR reducing system RseC family protein [Peptoniphilus coxii]CAC9930375.1 positive regulator of sigma(E), RseC/MucC [Peptoniphilus coxii]
MIQIGRILSVNKGMAYMEVTRKGACGSGCATCTSTACESKSEFISVSNDLNAEAGDTVELYVNDHFVLQSIYKVYGIPLAAFLALIFIGQLLLPKSLANRDLYIFGLGALSFVLSFIVLKKVDKKNGNRAQLKMIKIL